MTNERLTQIRKAAAILNSITEEEWKKIASVIKLEKPAKKAETDHDKITNLMLQLGIPSNIKGFAYTRTAILYLIKVYDIHQFAITKDIYPEVAKIHNTTVSRAERGMRYAVDVAWGRGNSSLQEEIFGYSTNPNKGRPTNSEFLMRLADYLKSEIL